MEEIVIKNKQESEGVSLKDLIMRFGEWFRYFLSKWIILLTFAILGGILGYICSKLDEPVYTARTTFVLEESDKGGGLGQYAGLASMAGIDLGGGGGGIFQGDNILELYKSRIMIQKTLLTEIEYKGKRELLVDRYIEFNDLRKQWSKKPELKGLQFRIENSKDARFTRLQDSVLGTIFLNISKNYLNVLKPDKKLGIIKADIKAPDEFFAKAFDEQLVKNVNDFYIQTKTKKSMDNILIMQQKTDSVRRVMNGAIYSAAAINDATPNLNITRQIQRSAPVQRSQFSVETNKAFLAELIKNLELSKISLRKETPLIQVIDQPILPLEKKILSKPKGIVVGAFLGGVVMAIFLFITRFIKKTLS